MRFSVWDGRNPVATAPGSDLGDSTVTDGGELTHSYSLESGGEVKMTKQEIIEMIRRAGFDARRTRHRLQPCRA